MVWILLIWFIVFGIVIDTCWTWICCLYDYDIVHMWLKLRKWAINCYVADYWCSSTTEQNGSFSHRSNSTPFNHLRNSNIQVYKQIGNQSCFFYSNKRWTLAWKLISFEMNSSTKFQRCNLHLQMTEDLGFHVNKHIPYLFRYSHVKIFLKRLISQRKKKGKKFSVLKLESSEIATIAISFPQLWS